MTSDPSQIIAAIRERFLGEYKHLYDTESCIRFFQDLATMAASVGASAWSIFLDGMMCRLRKDTETALKLYQQAIELAPTFAYPWHGKGNVLDDLKRYDEALAAYDRAIELDPTFAYPWNGKGCVLGKLKRYDEALAAFDRAIALDPKFASPWNGKGNVFREQKHYDEALAAYEHAIELNPTFAYPWHGKGAVLNDLKRYDEALAAFDRAIELNPKYAYPWNGKGAVLDDLKRHDEALAAYDRAIELDPTFAYPWHGKGIVLGNLKRHDEALAAYDRAIELDPTFAYPWNGKGIVFRELKRYDEALAAYDRAIQLDPTFAYPWNGKGNVLGNLKRHDEALAAYDRAIQLDPEYPGVHYNIGLLHWDLKRPQEAEEAFRRAIELNLEPEWKEVANTWIDRIRQFIESQQANKSETEREQADRSSDAALLTTLFEEIKDQLPTFREKKQEFKRQMRESLGKERIIGNGPVDGLFLVLRDWNSFSPILRRELRGQGGPGPAERLGGGYFLIWKGRGIVIDPGVDFVTQLYRKGFSIADVDTVIITHCHLDHTRDVESLVDLNYRYNEKRGASPYGKDKDKPFRELEFCLCPSAYMKYREHFITTGCCRRPRLLEQGESKRIGNFIEVKAVPTQHRDVNGRDDEAIGLVFTLKDGSDAVVRVGLTSDTRWADSLSANFSGCDIVVAHLGTIEVGESPTAAKAEEPSSPGEEEDCRGFLTDDLKNHLGTKGCFRLLQQVKPKIFVVGEFGEELVETRIKILRVLHRLKPDETQLILGGDSNLTLALGKELAVCCSHPECAQSWNRILLNEVRAVLGREYLFQYLCSRHSIAE